MLPFCDAKAYEARYGDPGANVPIDEILMDASRKVAAELDDAGIDWRDPDSEYAGRLQQVTRDMAYRALSNQNVGGMSDFPVGASQFSLGANGFSQSFGYGQGNLSASFGELYVSRNERKLLGILGKMSAGSLSPYNYHESYWGRDNHARR